MTYTEEDFTGWYPPEEKPVRPGVYPTRLGVGLSQRGFSKWMGQGWGSTWAKPEDAMIDFDLSIFQNKYWRGLKVKP